MTAVLEDGREGPCDDHVEIVADRYRLGPVLRRSTGTCAHRAYDELLQRTVRVTLVAAGPGAQASFALRPQGWQDRDPELAELFDAGREHDRLFLVTHHPDEPTLAETTPPGGLDLGQVRHLGTAVATALVPRHQRGAAHGGLGAGTVAFTPQGATLAEFGLLPWLARWGDVPVTPPYAAPEQRTGVDPGPASDVYALGRLLGELAPDHGLNPGVRALLVQMTAESPSARPTMAQVQRRLARRGRPRVPSAAGGASRRHGRRIGLVAAACCLVGSVVGLSAFAGEVPAVGSDGATLAATAALPAPVIALAPLPPPGSESTGDAVTDDTASGSPATAVARAVSHGTSSGSTPSRSTPSRSTPAATTSDDSPRVVDAVQQTSTDSDDRDGSGSTDHASPSTTAPAPDRSDQDTDRASAPTRSPATSGKSGSAATRSGHPVRGVLGRVSSSPGHHAPSTSGNGGSGSRTTQTTNGASSTADDHPQPKSRSPLTPDALDTTAEAS